MPGRFASPSHSRYALAQLMVPVPFPPVAGCRARNLVGFLFFILLFVRWGWARGVSGGLVLSWYHVTVH